MADEDSIPEVPPPVEVVEEVFSEEVEDKYQLIIRDLQEMIGYPEVMKKIIRARPFRIYWGTAPTGEIHIGYLKPMLKIVDFLNAGCDVQILLADVHAYLDAMKSTEKQLSARTGYYQKVIRAILGSLGADLSRISFVIGSSFQYSREYTHDIFRAMALTTDKEGRKAGSEVVKQSDSAPISSLMYPGMQALDEEHLGVDAQFGGVDQRKIFMLAKSLLPKLGYKKRVHLMNPMVQALSKVAAAENTTGGKMSASSGTASVNIKVDLVDTPKNVRKKLASAYCLPGDAEDNTPLNLLEGILFPLLRLKGEKFVVSRKEEFGGDVEYDDVEQVKADFGAERLHPADLKSGMATVLSRFLEPIQEELFTDGEFIDLVKRGYGKKLQVPDRFRAPKATA